MAPIYKLREWFPIDKINWEELRDNPHPYAVEYIKENYYPQETQQKISWDIEDPDDKYLIEGNLDNIYWYTLGIFTNTYDLLCRNPSIFVYDYRAMRDENCELMEEIKQTVKNKI